MPNPKTGTVTFDVGEGVQEVKAGKVEFRTDKDGAGACAGGQDFVHARQVVENATVVISSVIKAKPTRGQGQVHQGLLPKFDHGAGNFD
jgi:large subunit ribosomal protein L1